MPNNFNDPSSENDKNAIPESEHSPELSSSAGAQSGQTDDVENFWQELLYIVVMSVVLAVGIRWLVAEARYIPSESMLPTLKVNDRLIVEKMSYRFRDPKRGDIVVFKPTDGIKERQPDLKDALIKRIVGVPGDTIELVEGVIYINEQKMLENYTFEAIIPPDDPHYQWGPEVIPEDSYLVLGDNRLNSYDGVFWGLLPEDKIIGRAAVRIWPLGRMGSIDSEDPIFEFQP
ncbi:MAG: signal peptidase I [Cyanobacteria bacterium P01_F01_bin.150]